MIGVSRASGRQRLISVSLAFTLGAGSAALAAESPDLAASGNAQTASALPAGIDLRPRFERWEFGRSRQGDRPTCSVFTVVGALEFAIAKRQGSCPRLSVEFLNWAANRVTGAADDGAFFSDLWDGFTRFGICANDDMPYNSKLDPALALSAETLAAAKCRLDLGLRFKWIKEWDVKTGLTDEQLVAIRRTLHAGWPVCGGFRWPKREQWVNEVLQMCPADQVRDGHSVLLVGYRDSGEQPGGGVFIFRNTSHEGKDGFMPYAYARENMNDAAWIE